MPEKASMASKLITDGYAALATSSAKVNAAYKRETGIDHESTSELTKHYENKIHPKK